MTSYSFLEGKLEAYYQISIWPGEGALYNTKVEIAL